MSNESFHIPRHGGAGPALLGVEFRDTYILIVSIFVALVAGRFFGAIAYLGIPFAGYHANRQYLEWKGTRLPGFVGNFLFGLGLKKYSKAFGTQRVVYVGDGKVINPATKHLFREATGSGE